jgi:hypothetical protein
MAQFEFDATGLSRGNSRWELRWVAIVAQMPPACPVEFHAAVTRLRLAGIPAA